MMRRSTLPVRLMSLAFGMSILSAVASADAPTFTLQVLTTIPGGFSAYASGVNEAGEAVGTVLGNSVCTQGCAVMWQDGTPTLLGAAPNETESQAYAINNAGQVAGNVGGIGFTTAAVWNNGTPTLLLPPATYQDSYAIAINDIGEVAGGVKDSAGETPAVWNGLTPTVLDAYPNCTSGYGGAVGINSGGIAVGEAFCPDGRAIVWHGTTPTVLGAGEASAINSAGLIVGIGVHGATAWINGVETPLQGIAGAYSSADSWAMAVSNRGTIVGRARMNNSSQLVYNALLWSNSSAAPLNLNFLIGAAAAKEYVLSEAVGISDNCTIVVNGYARKDAPDAIAFVLKPSDPSTCASGAIAEKRLDRP
jgi:uncharacterized membrane protein